MCACSLLKPGTPEPTSSDTNSVSEVLKLFILVRGLRTTLLPCQAQLSGTQFAPWAHGVWIIGEDIAAFEYVPCPPPQFVHLQILTIVVRPDPPVDNCPLPQDTFAALHRLSTFFHINLPEAMRDDYKAAVAELRKAATLIAHAGIHVEIGMLMFFPYVVPESIIGDIQAGSPYAMILLAYFALLLSVLEPSFWYIQGWSRQLFATIETGLEDYPGFQDMARWPREQAFQTQF